MAIFLLTFIVLACSVAVIFTQHSAPVDSSRAEQDDLRPASEILLNSSEIGPGWSAADPVPMNLSAYSYTDLAESGFNRTYNGSEQSFTFALMKFSTFYQGFLDLSFAFQNLSMENPSVREIGENGSYGPGAQATNGWNDGGSAGHYYLSSDNQTINVFLLKGNVLVGMVSNNMDLDSMIEIANKQCDQVFYVMQILPPGTVT